MRFLADMGISPRTVDYLVTLGYDAIHIGVQGHERLEDHEILQLALDEDRVLLTHDLDFGKLMAARAAQFPSVIMFRLRNMQPDVVNPYLRQVLDSFSEHLEAGSIVSVSTRRIRTRSLPIEGSE